MLSVFENLIRKKADKDNADLEKYIENYQFIKEKNITALSEFKESISALRDKNYRTTIREQVEQAEKVKICIEELQEHSKELMQAKRNNIGVIGTKHKPQQTKIKKYLILTLIISNDILNIVKQEVMIWLLKLSPNGW